MGRVTRWILFGGIPLGRFRLSNRLIVALLWILITVVGFAFVQKATSALSSQFSLPGQQAYETNVRIAQAFHLTGGENPPVVPVITLPHESAQSLAAGRAEVARIFAEAASVMPQYRMAWSGNTGN